MSTSPIEPRPAVAKAVRLSATSLTVDLADGRSIEVPLAWYPRASRTSSAVRNPVRANAPLAVGLRLDDRGRDERCAKNQAPTRILPLD